MVEWICLAAAVQVEEETIKYILSINIIMYSPFLYLSLSFNYYNQIISYYDAPYITMLNIFNLYKCE